MDLMDEASQVQELHLRAALSNRKQELPATGKCHWCEEPAKPGAHFCTPECRDDWSQHQRFKG